MHRRLVPSTRRPSPLSRHSSPPTASWYALVFLVSCDVTPPCLICWPFLVGPAGRGRAAHGRGARRVPGGRGQAAPRGAAKVPREGKDRGGEGQDGAGRARAREDPGRWGACLAAPCREKAAGQQNAGRASPPFRGISPHGNPQPYRRCLGPPARCTPQMLDKAFKEISANAAKGGRSSDSAVHAALDALRGENERLKTEAEALRARVRELEAALAARPPVEVREVQVRWTGACWVAQHPHGTEPLSMLRPGIADEGRPGAQAPRGGARGRPQSRRLLGPGTATAGRQDRRAPAAAGGAARAG